MIGDLDAVVAEILRSLRPIADFGGIGADVARGKESVQQHPELLYDPTHGGR
jgi:hypothetical protein